MNITLLKTQRIVRLWQVKLGNNWINVEKDSLRCPYCGDPCDEMRGCCGEYGHHEVTYFLENGSVATEHEVDEVVLTYEDRDVAADKQKVASYLEHCDSQAVVTEFENRWEIENR